MLKSYFRLKTQLEEWTFIEQQDGYWSHRRFLLHHLQAPHTASSSNNKHLITTVFLSPRQQTENRHCLWIKTHKIRYIMLWQRWKMKFVPFSNSMWHSAHLFPAHTRRRRLLRQIPVHKSPPKRGSQFFRAISFILVHKFSVPCISTHILAVTDFWACGRDANETLAVRRTHFSNIAVNACLCCK